MVSSLQISLNMRDNLGDLRLDGTIIKLDIKEIGCEDCSGEGRYLLQL
jgi:hypothetical protein